MKKSIVLQTIGCDPSGVSAWIGVNTVTPPGMGMPASFSCNLYNLDDKTGWTSVAVLESNGNMWGLTAAGGGDGAPDAGYAPVCALAH